MKAWRVSQHGGNEVLEQKEIELQPPQAGEVQIQVEAVGLNHLDLWVRKGVPGHHFPLPITPGCDVSGTISEIGALSSSQSIWKKGMPVIVSPGISCGHCVSCLEGNDPLCPQYGILGETQDGGCAERVNVPVQNLIARPENLSAKAAAAIGIPFLTAWEMLVNKAKIKPADLILIQAAGSGVSSAAIQIAKQFGATVITTVGSDDKKAKAQKLGADYVINYQTHSFRDEVKKISKAITSVQQRITGCNIVLDHVGSATFKDSMRCLSPGGKFVTCGATTGGDVSINLNALFFKNLAILGSTMGSKSDFMKIVDLVSNKVLTPLIDRTLPMKSLPEALDLIENRKVFGRVVLENGK